ncbi:MAG: hypothetical protein C0613_15995 [Desulfobulbaceae bacterium]|nr:MAG: hypothetical protein C0613_15995 [Desulfobulbaceae bacterium]
MMQPRPRPYKRKVLNLTVNRAMQMRLISRVSVIVMASLLLMSAVYYQYANQEINGSFMQFHITARNFLDFLLPVVGIAFVVSLLAGGLASLFVPKSLAGPLYRMEEDLRRIAAGDLTVRVKLRDGDEGAALAAQINETVDHFQKTASLVWVAMHQAENLCETSGVRAEDRLLELRALCTRVNSEINKLKL